MKISYKILGCVLLLIGMSCDPDRVDSPPLANTEDSYFSNVIEFRNVLVGAYAKLYDFYHYNRGNYPNSLWLLPGDDLTETQAARTPEELFDGRLNSTNSRLEWIFDNTYEMIQKCNVVIQKVNNVDYSNYDGAEEITRMEGEALFLRSYAYFSLFNIYGNVPIITERLTAGNTNTPKSDKLEVLNQVVEDARAAIPILPESWDDRYRGRATKNSARGLLVKALVFRANYTGDMADHSEAISVFNSITATLLTDYTDNFDHETENNAESLFEIQAAAPNAINNIQLYNDGPWRGVEDMSVFRGMMTPAGNGLASDGAGTRFIVTEKLLDGFGNDPRISFFLREDDNEGGRLFQKYTLPELDERLAPHFTSINNERVLRYADLKLLIAEAQLKTGNPSVAIEHVNDVRARARNWGAQSGEGDGSLPENYSTSETNNSTIMEWIMNERFVELAGEGHRWWDLKRWHESGDINLTGWTGSDDHFSTALASPVQFDVSKHLLFPIPQTEISRNDEILNNNPGY
ncbi:RagB/SusD family nutrient uptake outer membrane protein [Zunongwangia sp. F260]|uniref:RagB/SusD family nutrient uptake outer membrane protein n=1 Tax=Autumnicola lenta TaxID=3075593 RepID=A0ABU3CP58_9FLAO|nr:RagB/SusD family nutrient uptake outer membrane protein [Zunongwangia sp. F260]MDT0647998.1 RagB/SusD family nutrient uptake outer membrane protein [Zunongwangia sp. F260]